MHPPLPPPLFLLEVLNLLPNFFKKGGAWQDLNFERGVAGKEGGSFFQGGLQFYKKTQLKPEIFNDKKSL